MISPLNYRYGLSLNFIL